MNLSKNDHHFLLTHYHNQDDDFIQMILDYCNEKYKNEGTRANKISCMKKCCVTHQLLDDPDKAYMISDSDLYQKLNKQRLANMKTEKKPLDQAVVDCLKNCKQQASMEKKNNIKRSHFYIYFLLITGLRPSEFLLGDFSIRNDDLGSGPSLYIKKLLKKRNCQMPESGYKLNLLYETPESFMDLLDEFNDLRCGKNNKCVMYAASKLLSAMTDGKLRLKDLRPVFIALSKLKPENKFIKQSCLVNDLLHHENVTTSIYYTDQFEII